MSEPIAIKADDTILKTIHFKPYRNLVERRYEQFLPKPGEPERVEIATPWGESLTATPGDYILSEMDNPNDQWPVNKETFEKTYEIIRPGICIKRALTNLAHLTDVTAGDANREVTVYTLEGPVTVRAGDFYLAQGAKGEIWPIPNEKIGKILIPAE